jgi:hypothetical protein
MKFRAAIVIALAAVALAACSSGRGRTVELPGGVAPEEATDPNDRSLFDRVTGVDRRRNAGPCPLMGVLYDSSRMVDFAQPNNERYANIEFTGEMQGVRGLCRYVDADPIRMSIEVDMAFGRGPATTAESQTYRYWVAVARRGYAPIEKVYFDVEARWDRDEQVVRYTQEIEDIVIPRANADTSGENFEILVGFELTPEQLAFNRAGKRFRVGAVSGQP